MRNLGRRQPVADTVDRQWAISLGGGLVVLGAVALLLSILARTAEQIQAGAAEIWRVGKLLANNTVHVAMLMQTNQHAAQISEAADGIAAATTRIQRAVRGPNP